MLHSAITLYPGSKYHPDHYLATTIHSGASIGPESIVLPGLMISKSQMVGSGSVVTRGVPDNSVFVGNPARIIRSRLPSSP